MTSGRARVGWSVAAVLALAAPWLFAPLDDAARGWLVGFALLSGLPLGSLVLLMIHRLVGGRWGHAMAPVLRPAATAVPLLVLVFLPIGIALWHLYPWAQSPDSVQESVVTYYLNPPWFLVRASVALVVWAILGIVFGRGGGGPLLAGIGLTCYGLTISFTAIDWYLSSSPPFVSSAFASMIAIQQLLTALAAAAVIGPATLDRETAGDVGGLMIATLLAVVYLGLMTFIVDWYGDLPEKAAWYVGRGHLAWALAIGAAILLAVASFGMLLRQDVRQSRSGLRVAGTLALAGIAIHLAWIIVPAFPGQTTVILTACLFGVGFLFAAMAAVSSVVAFAQAGSDHAR